jgi:hypothetical protein
MKLNRNQSKRKEIKDMNHFKTSKVTLRSFLDLS